MTLKKTMNDSKLLSIIDSTPLVSIDLIIKNPTGKVLLGLRNNRPAQDFWFVPGGRIRKNETLSGAMHRIASTEVGINIAINNAQLLGTYDHIYEDNFLAVDNINTHYVVLAYCYQLTEEVVINSDNQHSTMRWWDSKVLMNSANVHQYTKNYF